MQNPKEKSDIVILSLIVLSVLWTLGCVLNWILSPRVFDVKEAPSSAANTVTPPSTPPIVSQPQPASFVTQTPASKGERPAALRLLVTPKGETKASLDERKRRIFTSYNLLPSLEVQREIYPLAFGKGTDSFFKILAEIPEDITGTAADLEKLKKAEQLIEKAEKIIEDAEEQGGIFPF